MIGPEQNAFVKERYIGDTVRIISDILFETQSQGIKGILFGADFAAAFDSVDHIFMYSVLKKYGFSDMFLKTREINVYTFGNCYNLNYMYISPDEEPMRFEKICGIKDVQI